MEEALFLTKFASKVGVRKGGAHRYNMVPLSLVPSPPSSLPPPPVRVS